MVVNDFYVVRVASAPSKADTPLVVDTDAVLAFSVSAEHFQAITRRYPKVVQPNRTMQVNQFSSRDPLNIFAIVELCRRVCRTAS